MNGSSVLPLLSQIAEAQSIDGVWRLTREYFASIGLSHVNYGFTRFKHQTTIGDPDDALFLTTGDDAYAQRYYRGGFYAKSPLFRWAQRNSGACTWKWATDAFAAGKLCAEEAEVMRFNASIGVIAGLSFSFPETSARAKGVMGLTADFGITVEQIEDLWREKRHEIMAVAHMAHLKIIQLPRLSRARALSPRQREALEWVADGKTTQDVALLMGVSPAMVEKHLRLAREALAVETTAQAVAKAALLNMIFQEPTVPQAQAAR
ncbi:autoinducer binding domain-containing protein [Xinfangfangia sp. CPCC 101601]|uniref:Autoinducer binding domain-containing protein n=1 Tax=Pseudogemmobacter lacusdianii TaxID=3069608 RepID=A0ABU0VV45_9RHOB|nr:LuxR family transcriptional regulator [Xinfangfangia sp. CPCC 101601]MDQ2065413.1 autoinducer binding domain-containing protein [Xinfangfangia sp. CPCC 101601]